MRFLTLLAGAVLVGSLVTASVILLTPHKPFLLASGPSLATAKKPERTLADDLPAVVRAEGAALAGPVSRSVAITRLKTERQAKVQALRRIVRELRLRR